MTTTEWFEWGVRALILSSSWIVFVLLVRKPVARWIGSRFAYQLWLVPLVGLVTNILPSQKFFNPDHLAGFTVPSIDWMVSGAAAVVSATSPAAESHATGMANAAPISAVELLLFTWAAGAAISLLVLAVQSIKFSRRLNRQYRRPTAEQSSALNQDCNAIGSGSQVVTSMLPAQYGPAVVGVFRPVLLLPEDFFDKYTPLQRRLILLHEFHHVRRHDLLWLCIARIYRCLFWFNPIAYVAERYIQRDQELSCDEFVLADQENSTRKIYGETLLASLHRQRPLPYAPYLPTFNQIKERTSMLKHHHHQSIHSVLGSFLVFASLFASAAYGLTTAQEQPLVDAQAEFQKDLQAIYQRISNPELTVPQYAQVLHEVEQMESALQADSASDLALAQVANLSGYLCFLMEDFQCAIEKYTVILGLKHGNSALQAATTKTIAQLYFSLENYEQSLLFMDQLEALNGVTPEIMMFKAQTYYQMNNYSRASAYANRAVALAEFNDQIPKENWYQLQISLSTETGDLSAAEAALKKLNDHYPDNKYSAEMR